MKKLFKIINFFLIIFTIVLTLFAVKNHTGNPFYYLSFSIVVNLFFIYSLNKDRLFFEIYFATFVWLGFWFKYTLSLIFLDGIIYDSGPPSNIINIDQALLVSMVAISGLFLSYFLRRKFFVIKSIKQNNFSFFEKFYLKNKKIILFFFLIIFLLIAFLNFNLSIYQKGFIYDHNISTIYVNIVKWMLLFGLTTFSTFFIYTEIFRVKKISILTTLVVFFEIFVSYSSMLSRSVILNLSAITFSFTKFLSLIKDKIKFFFGLFILILAMFFINNYFSNHYRIDYAIKIGKYEEAKKKYDKEIKEQLLKKNSENNTIVQFKVSNDPTVKPDPINMSSFVVINRWSGIDSMLAVVSSNKLSFDLFFQSLKEKKIISKKTFYETTFKLDLDGGKEVRFGENRILKGNTLPGIISFLFYSGNYYFLFFSIILLTLFFCWFEIICVKISNNNMIFSSFISYMIAFRLSNFGYAPADSYLYILSIIGSITLMFFLSNYKNSFFNLK